ncbi:MAG: lysophospholipase [Cyclobacteriaceae bacterium]|nr:lysophospholipase [Cyclobacteriaceae bacterium]
MTESLFDFYTTDGLCLKGVDWSIDNPKAVIALVHGHGEHKMRYQHVAKFFSTHDIAMVALDLRGHGKSEGKTGHTPSYDQWLSDIEHFLMEVRNRYTEIPLILYGHSMGGNIVTNYLLRKESNDIKAAIVTDPLFRIAFEPPKWKIMVGNLMANIWPSLTQPTGLNEEDISSDPNEVDNYKNDPLVHNKMSTRMFVDVFAAVEWAMDNAKKLTTPTLMMHGLADEITSSKGSEEFAQKSNDQVTLQLWEGMCHEIHNEVDRLKVFEHELAWLNSHI